MYITVLGMSLTMLNHERACPLTCELHDQICTYENLVYVIQETSTEIFMMVFL